MNGPATDPLDEPSPSPARRVRWRIAVLLLAAGIFVLPWHGAATGAERAGAPAALALLASWGLAATALVAGTRRGLRMGEAATCAALAALTVALVAVRHPWLPGPDRRATWVPVFGPLALLAGIDLLSAWRRVPVGAAVAGIRAGAALVAAAALLVARQGFPAGVAVFLWAAPAVTGFASRARGARRGLEVLALLAALVLFTAPEIQSAVAPPAPSVEVDTFWAFLHRLVAVVLVVITLRGVLWPEARDAAPAAPAA